MHNNRISTGEQRRVKLKGELVCQSKEHEGVMRFVAQIHLGQWVIVGPLANPRHLPQWSAFFYGIPC